MPRANGMGPMGLGPMTGRGAGFCAGYRHGNGQGKGFGGRGLGFQLRMRGAMPTELTVECEKAFLQKRVAILARELEDANKRLAELNETKES